MKSVGIVFYISVILIPIAACYVICSRWNKLNLYTRFRLLFYQKVENRYGKRYYIKDGYFFKEHISDYIFEFDNDIKQLYQCYYRDAFGLNFYTKERTDASPIMNTNTLFRRLLYKIFNIKINNLQLGLDVARYAIDNNIYPEIKQIYCLNPIVHHIFIGAMTQAPNNYAVFNGRQLLIDFEDFYIVCYDKNNVPIPINQLIAPSGKKIISYISCKSFYNSNDYIRIKHYDGCEFIIQLGEREIPMDKKELDMLYLNNCGKKSKQYELWQECNNLCNYCYLGKENRLTTKERKLESIQDCLNYIEHFEDDIYNNISIIGGEFFQGQLSDKQVHDAFMVLMEKIASLYQQQKIGSIWITASMTTEKQDDLWETLAIFKKHECFPKEEYGSSGLWICTSWDVEGRFHTEKSKQAWENNMHKLKQEYNWVKLNTTIILTSPLLKLYNAAKFSFSDFEKEYGTTLFFKQPGAGEQRCGTDRGAYTTEAEYFKAMDEDWMRCKKSAQENFGLDFFPERKVVLRFFNNVIKREPHIYDRLFNVRYRADELNRNFNQLHSKTSIPRKKGDRNEDGTQSMRCGHILNYAAYIDSNACWLCDKAMVGDSFTGK